MTGPTVVDFEPSAPTNQNVSSFTVKFDEPIQESTFTPSQVTITGPNGPVDMSQAVVTALDQEQETFQVSFPTQSADGQYAVSVGPDITDLSGNAMSIVEVTDEQFLTQPSDWTFNGSSTYLPPGSVSWTSNGVIRLTSASGYETGSSFFGQAQPADPFVVSFDFNIHDGGGLGGGADGMTFVVAQEPNQGSTGGGLGYSGYPGTSFAVEYDTYNNGGEDPDNSHVGIDYNGVLYPITAHVDPLLGGGSTFHTIIRFDGKSLLAVQVQSPDGHITTLSYNLPAAAIPSEYTFGFTASTGAGYEDADISNVAVYLLPNGGSGGAYTTTFTIDKTPPTVVGSTPTGVVNAPVSQVDVTFNKLMNISTLNSSNITLTGPSGNIPLGQPYLVSGTTYAIPFALERANGTYQLNVGAAVQDLAGGDLGGSGYQASYTVSLPDLVTSAVNPSSSSASLGDTLNVGWTVTNSGTAPAVGPWTDNVYLSTTPTLGAAPIYLGSFAAETGGALAAGGSYTGQATVQIPFSSSLMAGTYYLVVLTDAGGVVNESVLTTQQSSAAITLAVPPPPDLTASGVSTSSTSAQPGQSETVTWSVENVGGSPATGSWTDDVYLAPNGTLTGATLLGSVSQTSGLAAGGSYAGTLTRTLPASLADGTYQVIVITDAGAAVVTDPNRANNESTASQPLTFGHVDLVPSIASAPTSATSGTSVTVDWSTTNMGTASTLSGWVDRAYLSTTSQVTATSLLLGAITQSGPLTPGQSTTGEATETIPLGDGGTYQIIVVADATSQLIEPGGVSNSTTQGISIALAPYADLAVSNVVAPAQTIGDPAYPVISWTVTNVGTGAGQTSSWTDAVIASPSNNDADPNAVTLADYMHTGGLAVGASYTQTQTVQMPAGFTGRYHLFVETDSGDAVFENGSKANNVGEAPNNFDVMPIPYADLVVSSIVVPQPAGSGLPLNVTWTITNQGIGLTNTPSWSDDLALASDPAGKNIIQDYGLFNHLGPVGPGGSYVRTAQVTLPEGLNGTYYFVVTAAAKNGPFEFIYGDGTDNISVSAPFTINLTPPPDLTVTSVSAPTTGEEGSTIQVGWTVQNVGPGQASGSWQDEVVIQQAGQPSSQFLILGTFTNFSAVDPGKQYTRTEAVNLPLHISGLYNVEVIANYDGELFENGATANNTGIAPQPITVTVTPRPDLQVAAIDIPSTVNAGGTFSVTYTVINQGSAPTTVNWDDKIYLSLTPQVEDDSILIQDLPNQSALDPGDEYQATTVPVTVPDRYAGQVYVIVDVDANHVVDQWPNGTHDLEYQPVYVNPIPLPDLVMSNVVAPTQVIAGTTFNVSFTVTNLGSGPTLEDEWTDSVWLALDKTRPIPAKGDILLTEATHTGALALDAGYDETLSVTLPVNLQPGTYYVTPWTDLYSTVLQNTLAVNVNPDDPNNFQSDNYKARQIDILAPLPDLVVTTVTAPATATGGVDNFTVNWTVENTGNGVAQPTGWIDTVYLTNDPTDPLNQNAITMTLGSVTHNTVLNVDASYNASLTVELSPSAVGHYIVVYTDAPQPNITTPYNVVEEVSETNNLKAVSSIVTPVPADLVITNVSIPTVNYSGEKMTFTYTVENQGPDPVWGGTAYWTDFIWVSPEPTFNRFDASFLGQTTHAQTTPLEPGQSYTINYTVTLPPGTSGPYYLYIDLDAHNDLPPNIYIYQARLEMTDWWPADTGDNSYWLSQFNHWAFEDPNNNRLATPFNIIYREPDLTVTNITVPANVISGSTVPITYTVTNRGTRATRTASWTDRIFLSQDPSLDIYDTVLGQTGYGQVLAAGASYTETLNVRIPDGIQGDFDIIVYADSDAQTDFSVTSDIGFGLYGVKIGVPDELNPYDLASVASRSLGRGNVPQYEDEADKISSVPLPITLAPAPHLQVTAISSDANAGHVFQGQTLDVTYTVTNTGAATPPTMPMWDDLIYFSADTNLDLKADTYLGMVEHMHGLGAGASYTITTQVQVPVNLSGPYYLFVITNPPVDSPIGMVFEGGGANQVNSLYLAPPLVIDPPPASQLVVSGITLPDPATVKSGDPFSVGWTVTDESTTNPAPGSWSDAVYIGMGTSWSIADVYLGTVAHTGTLAPGDSYTGTLAAVMPSLTPGQYHIFVRTDIFDQLSLPAGVPESSKTTASADLLTVAVDSLTLGVPYATTLSSGQERLLQVTVPQGATLEVTLSSNASGATNEVYLKQGSAPTQSVYDAAYQGGLSPNQTAVIPSTIPGVYYILIEGNSEPADDSPVSVLAALLPLSITNVQIDQGGDSAYVTTTISGAQFQSNAIVKLVMPGFAEYQPLITNFVNSTEILAEFDLTGAPFGLYDVQVTNPDGQQAIAPYRFEIEQTVQPDVTIGVGGPRFILAGDTGTYSVALQNLGNINAPYVEFNVGIPQLSNAFPTDLSNPNIADPVNVNLFDLPYVELNTNLSGAAGLEPGRPGAVCHAPVTGRHGRQ